MVTLPDVSNPYVVEYKQSWQMYSVWCSLVVYSVCRFSANTNVVKELLVCNCSYFLIAGR